MTSLAFDDIVESWAVASAREPLIVVEPLVAFLEEHGIASGRPDVSSIGGGLSNETFLLSFDDGERVVLRRPPRGPLPPSAHDVLRESRVLRSLAGTAVPVPAILATCTDPGVIGAPFVVMEHVGGTVPLLGLPRDLDRPEERRRLGEALVDALAVIHSIDLAEAGLDRLGRPDRYLERQLERHLALWEHNRTPGRDLPEVSYVAAWLASALPERSEVTLVHGDFHPGNVMVADDAPARVVAVLDWELATRGDPLADLGYFCALWHEPSDPPEHPLERAPVTRLPGFPSRAELVARYAEISGRAVDGHEWYQVLALWRAIIFMEGNYRRGASGSANTPFLAGYGDQVPRLARLARAKVDAIEAGA